MSFGLEVAIFLAYAAGLFLIYVLGKLLIVPIKWMGRLLVSSLVAGVFIVLVNIVGTKWGIFIPLNPVTAVLTALLGVPAAIGLLLFFNL